MEDLSEYYGAKEGTVAGLPHAASATTGFVVDEVDFYFRLSRVAGQTPLDEVVRMSPTEEERVIAREYGRIRWLLWTPQVSTIAGEEN